MSDKQIDVPNITASQTAVTKSFSTISGDVTHRYTHQQNMIASRFIKDPVTSDSNQIT